MPLARKMLSTTHWLKVRSGSARKAYHRIHLSQNHPAHLLYISRTLR